MAEQSGVKKLCSCVCRFVRLVWAWKMKFWKTRFQGCKRCKAQRAMDERVRRLGTEIYSLYKQGDSEFAKSLAVQQQLKLVEEAELHLIEILDRIEALEKEYQEKKQRLACPEEQEKQ
ncbi:MAG: hypothetical protein ABFD97_20035 [Syntrophobacter sp.]